MYYAVLMEKHIINDSVTFYEILGGVKGKINGYFFEVNNKGTYQNIPTVDYYNPQLKEGMVVAFPILEEELMKTGVGIEGDVISHLKNYVSEIAASRYFMVKSFDEDGLSSIDYVAYNQTSEQMISLDPSLDYYNAIVTDVEKTEEEEEKIPKQKSFNQIYKMLKNRILCQDEQIKNILTSIYINNFFDENNIKSNILVVGPTGVGKTEIFRAISEYLDIPVYITDANEYTMAGFVGKNVSQSVQGLFKAANYDIEKAERGIIIFDEIDKLSSKNDNEKVSTKGVLDSLLKLMEGMQVEVSVGKYKHTINTDKMTFVASGAFTEIENLEKETSVGFNNNIDHKNNDLQITPDLLVNYGMTREFIGRFNTIVQMNTLEKEDLKNILLNSSISALQTYSTACQKKNIPFSFDESTIDYIINKAYESDTGARGLDLITRSLIEKQFFNFFNNEDSFDGIELTQSSLIKK